MTLFLSMNNYDDDFENIPAIKMFLTSLHSINQINKYIFIH